MLWTAATRCSSWGQVRRRQGRWVEGYLGKTMSFLNIIPLTSRSRHRPESYSSAEGPDEHGGTDARGSGGVPGTSKDVILKRLKYSNLKNSLILSSYLLFINLQSRAAVKTMKISSKRVSKSSFQITNLTHNRFLTATLS